MRRQRRRVADDGRLAIETEGLVKVFGETRAVDGIDLAVRAGTVYGVLGPNGAGKTTTIRMLATLLRPDAGSARVLGHDVVTEADAVRGRVSLTGQFASVDEELTGRENLVLLGRLLGFGKRRRPAARADRAARRLRPGRRRRPAGEATTRAACAGGSTSPPASSSPPTCCSSTSPPPGLDPRSRNQVWEIVRVLVAEGTTVLLTTQYLDEADQLADRIAIIDHGRVIAEGTCGELKASVGSGALHVRVARPRRSGPTAAAVLAGALGVPVQLERRPGRRCRPGSPTPSGSPPRWPSWPRPASPSPSSRSASPAWTRCSSPSPATRPTDRRPATRTDGGRSVTHRHRPPTTTTEADARPVAEATLRAALSSRARPPPGRPAWSRRSPSPGGRCSRSSTSRCSCST